MTIETALSIGDRIYLKGISDHLGHVEAEIEYIKIEKSSSIVYGWIQQVSVNGNIKLWDSGEVLESELNQTFWKSVTEWAVANQEELLELKILDTADDIS